LQNRTDALTLGPHLGRCEKPEQRLRPSVTDPQTMTDSTNIQPANLTTGWYGAFTPEVKRTFWACFGGWALDAMDVQIFSFAIPAIIATFHISKADAGLIGTVDGVIKDVVDLERTAQGIPIPRRPARDLPFPAAARPQ